MITIQYRTGTNRVNRAPSPVAERTFKDEASLNRFIERHEEKSGIDVLRYAFTGEHAK